MTRPAKDALRQRPGGALDKRNPLVQHEDNRFLSCGGTGRQPKGNNLVKILVNKRSTPGGWITMFGALRFAISGRRAEGRGAMRRKTPRARSWGRRLSFDALEARMMLSGGASSPSGYSPNQVRGAYGLGSVNSADLITGGITFAGGIPGDGRGQTIAVIDAYDDPNALSDLNAFSAYFGLPQFNGPGGPTFEKLNQGGQTSPLPGTDPAGPGDSDWETEESLDIEWAHAMAPMANIILFEASSPTGLYPTALQTAVNTPGVDVVSMSFSTAEYSGETSYDSDFTTPAGHLGGSATLGGPDLAGGITFVAAAGDKGAYGQGGTTITANYPASSPNVVAAGGTTLTVGGSSPNYTWGGEIAWGNGISSGTEGGGGGGISAYESQPGYQSGVVSAFSTTKRTVPDVALDANFDSGVALYDSYDFGSMTPWSAEIWGGTSLACPLFAGMVAIADEGRAITGEGSLYGATQTLPALYKMPAADFHDIVYDNSSSAVDGNTMPGPSIGPSPEYSPGPGYDLATGLGSPSGNDLIPQLVGPNVVLAATTWPGSTSSSVVNLSALGADFGGESSCTYTWAATSLPAGASAPTFGANGTNAAKNDTATLSQAGTYVFTVTITDAVGLSVTSSTSITVTQMAAVAAAGAASPATTPTAFTPAGKNEWLPRPIVGAESRNPVPVIAPSVPAPLAPSPAAPPEDLAWFEQLLNGFESAEQRRKNESAIQAWDAAIGGYGQ
jgi:hypothetical protein